MKRQDRKPEIADFPELVQVERGGEPGFIAPMNWSEEEILDAMKAFEEKVRVERGLPPGEPR